ncbi:hypothetical protein [Dechloromonas sp. A34]|uniref:hypothetical protein n=1 Tax=Dechloromonas sp. A34 TaxID=447588 RepID=UPI0022495905|nr:hypothetical protein [Dechloromonas sp. A34]
MKTKLTTLTLVALLGVSGTTTALAHEDYSEGAMYHNLHNLTTDTQLRGAQGRPGERALKPLVGYGEGDMYDNLRLLTKDVQ